MENENLGLNKEIETPGDQPNPEKTPPPASEGLKPPEESPEAKAERILKDGSSGSKEIRVPKDKFDDINDEAKLYKVFAPLIDKLKDNPELVKDILEVKQRGSVEDRLAQIEEDRKSEKRNELKMAVMEALGKWEGFEKDWPEIKDDVERTVLKRGVSVGEAIRRHYIALHPEMAQAESERIARENVNAAGRFPTGGSRAPNVMREKKEANLNDRERMVAKDLLGKDYGGGFVPVKSEEDYARLLEKHKDHLRAKGFYDLP